MRFPMKMTTSTTSTISYAHQLYNLSEAEMSALVALYTLERKSGSAAFSFNEHIGVWLSDLQLCTNQQLQNDLGIYSIEVDVLDKLIDKQLVTYEKSHTQPIHKMNGKTCIYRLCPKAKNLVSSWMAVYQSDVPMLVQFNT